MSLREYKQKRHFDRTPEPAGKQGVSGGHAYVIQKHAASHLHYDFRLELDGVLLSWAVPKGPSLDPTVKRLAMHVEDHPLDYGSFEGVIPKGEYGGGTVMLWDHGTWEPVGDARAGYAAGKLKFILHGEKLHGGWTLVKFAGGRSHGDKDQRQWLLIKEKDAEASTTDVLEDAPLSVTTGRSMKEIAASSDRVWGPDGEVEGDKQGKIGRKAPMPRRVDVQLASLAATAPAGSEWLHEIKLDGYRIVCRIEDDDVVLTSRNHKDWTSRFPFLVEAARSLEVKNALLDGEVVALRADGLSDFEELQNSFGNPKANLCYFAFDLLYLGGHDLTSLPLEERKAILTRLLGHKGVAPTIRLSEHIEGDGPSVLSQACKMGVEGIVSKRRDQPYRSGRHSGWLKLKCRKEAEFVIGGYTDSTGSRLGFGALLLGYHDHAGDLIYAGRVGTGFNDRMLKSLAEQLRGLKQRESPFRAPKKVPGKVHWVEPKLIAQVQFADWTKEGIVRQAAFRGLREDKSPKEVTREIARPAPIATPAANSAYDPRAKTFAGVRLTSPDKVLYPEDGITKLDLATYYRDMAEWILPHIANRPLVLVRCPEGCTKECFFQKHPRVGTPDTLRRIPVREKTKLEQYVVADDAAALISLAQIAALEIHAWGSRADDLERPDRLIFDLDPDPAVEWASVVQAAQQIRQFLEDLGLQTFVKTTGGKGLHLVAPIEPQQDWDEAKAFCESVALSIVRADPGHFTANLKKAARTGKIYIDYLRNGRGSTAIIPYSPRAREGATVSVPLTWKELTAHVRSDQFTIRNIGERMNALKRDPWQGIDSLRQRLAGPIKKLKGLSAKS